MNSAKWNEGRRTRNSLGYSSLSGSFGVVENISGVEPVTTDSAIGDTVCYRVILRPSIRDRLRSDPRDTYIWHAEVQCGVFSRSFVFSKCVWLHTGSVMVDHLGRVRWLDSVVCHRRVVGHRRGNQSYSRDNSDMDTLIVIGISYLPRYPYTIQHSVCRHRS